MLGATGLGRVHLPPALPSLKGRQCRFKEWYTIHHARCRIPLYVRPTVASSSASSSPPYSDGAPAPMAPVPDLLLPLTPPALLSRAKSAWKRTKALLAVTIETPAFGMAVSIWNFTASLLFVGLYIFDTYQHASKGSFRYYLELLLCLGFASEYVHRLVKQHPDWGSKFRMVTSFNNLADLLSFAPPLLEALLPALSLGRFDLRWIKLLRSMRVMRVGLLGAELRSLHLSTKRGGWLTAGANFRLGQLATSVFMLLFIATAIIQVVEQMPFHQAMYLVATTLSTVGYGDIVPASMLGRIAILAMIAVGIVLIPVQAAAFYSEVSARRVIRGSLPDWRGKPFILLSTRLTEVRAFSDLYSEFRQALRTSARFPRATKLVALCNRPSFEFTAFQELHDRNVTLVEGSAVSGQDLVTVKAERALGILLLADRFTTDPEAEDLGILFQVWASKSYTKSVPLFVQTLRTSTVQTILPFLDPGQDVIVSMEQTRFRLLALSAVCPGASTLVGNLLRSSAVLPREAQEETLAGRRWLRQYVNGCEFSLCKAPVQRHLIGQPLSEVTEWLFRISGFIAIGVVGGQEAMPVGEGGGAAVTAGGFGRVRLNPASELLKMGMQLLVIGTGKYNVCKALSTPYEPLPALLKDQFAAGTGNKKSKATTTVPTQSASSSTGNNDEDEEACVPVYWGNPESDSFDVDEVPCIPAQVVDSCLQNPEEVKSFLREYEHDPRAQREQLLRGELDADTAMAMVDGGRNGDFTPAVATTYSFEGSQQNGTTPPFSSHFILCGHGGSVVPFMAYLRAAEPSRNVPIVVLSPSPPQDFDMAQQKYAPVYFVAGSPADAASLRAAGAVTAKALVFLARGSRPVKTAQATGAAVQVERSTREAVLADANALLACYGVGEESGAMTHAVVELLFTTSIEFLQPGLLLKGVGSMYDDSVAPDGVPRKSWSMRAWQQREAVAEGLAEWQANPYYAAGRVTVPALMDTLATQCFFNRGLMVDVLAEMCGDVDSGQDTGDPGALLRQIRLPQGFTGRTYGDLFMALVAGPQKLVCLGLYRRKTENAATKLSYVVANPPSTERLESTDRVFVLVERGVAASASRM